MKLLDGRLLRHMLDEEMSDADRERISKRQAGGKNSHARMIVNEVSGRIYYTVSECAKDIGISQGQLSNMLAGRRKNTTNLRYLTRAGK
jgi:hypothetical protein